MKRKHWLIISHVASLVAVVLFAWRVPDRTVRCPDCTCSAMRVITAPDGSLIDLSDWFLSGNGIGILIESSPPGTPGPTLTPMPTVQVLRDVKVIASVCNGRVVYPARMEVRYAGVVELDLVNALYGPLEGIYQVCPVGHDSYTDCWYVTAVNVELREVECATPTPESGCSDPDGLCIGSQWIRMWEGGSRPLVILTGIGEAGGVTYYNTDLYTPRTRDEFLDDFDLWEEKATLD